MKWVTGIGLTAGQIRGLAKEFRPDDDRLWNDIRWLAGHCWENPDDPSARHHLLLAVGNFKRQGGTVLRPPRLMEQTVESVRQAHRKEPFFAWGEQITVDGRDSWEALAHKCPGLGVATTTTLLSALWPDNHAIIDRRARSALVGLRAVLGIRWRRQLRRGAAMQPVSWNDYQPKEDVGYRNIVLDAHRDSSLPLLIIERALFEVDFFYYQKVRRHEVNETDHWETYGQALQRIAEEHDDQGD